MSISIIIDNEKNYWLLYSSTKFKAGKIVTGYFIYSNLIKSDIFNFVDLGDGIYSATVTHNQQTTSFIEKCGLVIKENGTVKKFELVQVSFS